MWRSARARRNSRTYTGLGEVQPAGHSDHFPTRVECVVQNRYRAVRSIRALGTSIRAVHGWTMSRCFAYRSMRCVVVVHPYTCPQERGPPSAYLSVADPYVGRFLALNLQEDKRVTLDQGKRGL